MEHITLIHFTVVTAIFLVPFLVMVALGFLVSIALSRTKQPWWYATIATAIVFSALVVFLFTSDGTIMVALPAVLAAYGFSVGICLGEYRRTHRPKVAGRV